jgi:hypothetical protein
MENRKQDGSVIRRLSAPLRALVEALAELHAPGMLIGGLAVIVHGVSRATRDVGATLLGGERRLEDILVGLGRHGIVPRISDALEFAAQHQVLLLRHQPSGIDVDITIAWLPFEIEAVRAAQIVAVDDVNVPVVRPEDLVIYKTVAWRPQDQQDVERLQGAYWATIDLGRVRRVVAEFAEALDQPERLAEFDRLADRLGV